ncbi:MAG: sugar transferase [bacterium]|nr:sugar transferase [bacterium]
MKESSLDLILDDHSKLKNGLYLVLKRSADILISGISLLLLWPIFLIVALMIKLDSKGVIIFKQKRIGKNGKSIYIYKFRTMIPNADAVLEKMMKENSDIYREYTINKKLKHDPRVTKIGNFLRKTSLDELPQLLNILIGDMSIVGPRPYLHREIEDMQPYYEEIIKMTPGLTGLWQVSGRNDITFKERCKLDSKYYHSRGIKQDVIIVIKTFAVVFLKKGAR